MRDAGGWWSEFYEMQSSEVRDQKSGVRIQEIWIWEAEYKE